LISTRRIASPLISVILVLGVAATPERVRAAEAASATAVAGAAAESVEQLAARAATAFRAGQFESALADYRRAIGLVSRPEDVATLQMNIGACLVELKRFEQAKTEFLSAAAAAPALAQKARLSAAMVAVELERSDEAEALLDAASPFDEALSPRAQDLKQRIAEKRGAQQREELEANLAAAAAAITAGDWPKAQIALLAAQKQIDLANASERVDILHGLGTVELALDRPNEAKTTLTAALQIVPSDPEIHFALGRVHQALGENAEARAEYRKALELGLKEPQAQSARDRVAAIDPLGPSEWFGWLTLAGGYDSNPRQSGAATETTLGRRGRGGSGYGRIAAELGRTQRISEGISLRLRYAGEWLGLQKRLVQDLSLQNHGVFGGIQWAPANRLTIGLEVGPSFTYIGLGSVSPFTWDFLGSAKLRYRASEVRQWRLAFDLRKITGLSGWEFLGGSRLDAELAHQWSYAAGHLRVGLRGRHLSIGTRSTTVDAAYLPACNGLCDGATYTIPLSYTGFGPVASARIDLASMLHLVASTQLDWRRYRDESQIVGIEQSRKRREDLRWTAGVDLEFALDENEHFMIVPSYAVLVSSSNVALSTSDPAHAFDYDDRSFNQHFLELGLEASF
jgi:tetratricopeptide (TPR) repeat protein